MNAKKATVLGTEDQPLGVSHGGQQISVVKPREAINPAGMLATYQNRPNE